MAFLQLADNYSMLAQNRSENYIFIPAGYAGATKDMNVREDYFDNLSDAEYMAMINELAPFQSQGLSAVGIAAVGAGAFNVAKNLINRRKARVAAGTAKPLFKPGGLISLFAIAKPNSPRFTAPCKIAFAASIVVIVTAPVAVTVSIIEI